jgi:hypothetical protein
MAGLASGVKVEREAIVAILYVNARLSLTTFPWDEHHIEMFPFVFQWKNEERYVA